MFDLRDKLLFDQKFNLFSFLLVYSIILTKSVRSVVFRVPFRIFF